MNGFTAEQAFDAQRAGDAELINRRTVAAILGEHGRTVADYADENHPGQDIAPWTDAADILCWLGY